MEKKLRIQLFSPEGNLISDRLVTQDPEFTAGPKGISPGVIRIEFTLEHQGDIDKAKTYLDQITGNLPLPEPRGRKQKEEEPTTDESRKELLEEALAQASDQDKLIGYLREHDFVFITSDFLETFDYGIDLKDKHKDEYQWMLRCLKRAKNPKVDKYDPMLLVGIKLIGDRTEKVAIYLNREYYKSYKVDLPSKPKETFKKSGMIKFPPYMTEDEREKFRFELRQYQDKPEKPISKFFSRWEEYVQNVPELENPRK